MRTSFVSLHLSHVQLVFKENYVEDCNTLNISTHVFGGLHFLVKDWISFASSPHQVAS